MNWVWGICLGIAILLGVVFTLSAFQDGEFAKETWRQKMRAYEKHLRDRPPMTADDYARAARRTPEESAELRAQEIKTFEDMWAARKWQWMHWQQRRRDIRSLYYIDGFGRVVPLCTEFKAQDVQAFEDMWAARKWQWMRWRHRWGDIRSLYYIDDFGKVVPLCPECQRRKRIHYYIHGFGTTISLCPECQRRKPV